MGLEAWLIHVVVSWDPEEQDLWSVVEKHLATAVSGEDDLVAALRRHGVNIGDEFRAVVGAQELVTGHIGSSLAEASGRQIIWTGEQFLEAADAEASDLNDLVAPLISTDEDQLLSDEIRTAWPSAEITDLVILLRSVNITPTVRGHGLGAWVAAQSVALFDCGASLVATKAAPMSFRDAIPGRPHDAGNLSKDESRMWRAEQKRLTQHWESRLGLRRLNSDPAVLVWHTASTNMPIEQTLRDWAI